MSRAKIEPARVDITSGADRLSRESVHRCIFEAALSQQPVRALSSTGLKGLAVRSTRHQPDRRTPDHHS